MMTPVVITLVFFVLSVQASTACQVGVRGDLNEKRPPVLFNDVNGQWVLATPSVRSRENTYFDFTNKAIGIACPGDRNVIVAEGQQLGNEIKATCLTENGNLYFRINGKNYKSKDIECKSSVSGFEMITGKTCGVNGKELLLGFMVKNKMYDIINTCHRMEDGFTLYSKHVIYGNHFPIAKFNLRGGERPRFNTQNKALYRGFPPYKSYNDENQKNSLASSIGYSLASQMYNKNTDNFFSKGHLAPNADFPLDSWRSVTFLFVNTVPQWQLINGGNWNEIESAVRNLAIKRGENLEVITGSSGILKPEIDQGNGKDLYLWKDHKLPVPETFYKIVKNAKNQCIGFISNNFPLKKAPAPKCSNICLQNRWPNYVQYDKDGFIYCCEYSDMKKIFPSIPNLNCNGILRNE